MRLPPFKMESWLSGHRFSEVINLAESGVRDLRLRDLLALIGAPDDPFGDLVMEDMPTQGSLDLREAIAGAYRTIPPERILVTTGTGEALFILFNTLLDPGDRAVVSFPAFQALYEIPRAVGAQVVFYEHRIEESYRFDAERFASLVTPGTRLVVLNTPHNPTGAECDAESLARIVEKTRSVGATLLFDEHYRFLPHDDRPIIPSGADLGEDLVATGSVTKCFGAMGLRIGWIVAPPPLIAACRQMRDYLSHTLSPISERLTTLALTGRDALLARNRRLLRENKAALGDFMARHAGVFDYVPPSAGVVCYPGVRSDLPSETLARRLIETCGVFCLPAQSFDQENRLRIGLGPEPARFREALHRMEDFFR